MEASQIKKLLKLKDSINGFLRLNSDFKMGKLDELSLQEKGKECLDKIDYLVHEINDIELNDRWKSFVENINKGKEGVV